MKEDHSDKLFKWLDFIRIVVCGLTLGLIAATVWCVKIQMTITDLEKHINDIEQNASIHRDAIQQRNTDNEKRFSRLEQWVIDHDLSKMQR